MTSNQESSRQSAKGKLRNMGQYNAHANLNSARQATKGKKRNLGAYNVQDVSQQAVKARKRNIGAYNASNNVTSNQESSRQSAKCKLRNMGRYNADVLNKSSDRQRLKSRPNNLLTSQGAAALAQYNARRSDAARKRSYTCRESNFDPWAWWIILRIRNRP